MGVEQAITKILIFKKTLNSKKKKKKNYVNRQKSYEMTFLPKSGRELLDSVFVFCEKEYKRVIMYLWRKLKNKDTKRKLNMCTDKKACEMVFSSKSGRELLDSVLVFCEKEYNRAIMYVWRKLKKNKDTNRRNLMLLSKSR